MCGIFAYLNYLTAVDRQTIADILTNGLKRLEYRGYDSAGKILLFSPSLPLHTYILLNKKKPKNICGFHCQIFPHVQTNWECVKRTYPLYFFRPGTHSLTALA